MKRYSHILTTIILVLLLSTSYADAGILSDAKLYLAGKASNLASWWGERSVANTVEDDQPLEEPAEEVGEPNNDDGEPAPAGTPGICIVPQESRKIVCEGDSEFLCLNTPERGVSGESIVVKGIVGSSRSTPANLSIAIQHDYTKKTFLLDTDDSENSDCWNSSLSQKNFCLSEDGYFSARLPLDELGPYTISVGATRFSGDAATKTERTSRVVALEMTEDDVSFNPDIKIGEAVDTTHVMVNVSLLGDCQNCDYIGASTSAVTVTAENVMKNDLDGRRVVTCVSSTEQGGQGSFVLGVPVSPGSNEITITACNPAVENSRCPVVGGIKFQVAGEAGGLEILSPPPLPAYSSAEYPAIPFEFNIAGAGRDDTVEVLFNRERAARVTKDGERYRIQLQPKKGINIVTVKINEEELSPPWVFGWGEISSPFQTGGEIQDGLQSNSAIGFAIPEKSFTEKLVPFITNILVSDELKVFLQELLGGEGDVSREPTVEDDFTIPRCEEGGSALENYTLSLLDEPIIGDAKIEDISFGKNELSFSLNVDRLTFRLGLIDEAGETTPLKISFFKAIFDLILKVPEKGDYLFISSPHRDCDYKRDRYCKGTPAALIPQRYVGDATDLGGIVKCDISGLDVSDETKKLCDALNGINAKTGLVNEAILDAVNSALYCTGSKVLTRTIRNGIRREISFPMGNILGDISLPLGADLRMSNGNGVGIDESGVLLTGGLVAGDRETFAGMPNELKIPSVGVISLPDSQKVLNNADTSDSDFKLSLSVDAINHLFFLLTSKTVNDNFGRVPLIDVKLSEPFFKKLGFDFVEKCDAVQTGDEPSTLCNIRPRVSELLGLPLTRYGYFEPNHPLMMRVSMGQALPPHLSIVSADDIPITTSNDEDAGINDQLSGNLLDLQIGGLIISFYALEVDENKPPDEYENLPIKLDGNGDPIIHSMQPGDPNPLNGQIVSYELALLLAVEIGDVKTDQSDPSKFALMVRPLANRSRLIISPLAGSNRTTVPPKEMISSLEEKLRLVLNMFSAEENAILVPIPKSVSFDHNSGDLFELVGLKKINFGPDGLNLGFEEGNNAIIVDISASIEQLLNFGGMERIFEY